jgi:hypothetical protein
MNVTQFSDLDAVLEELTAGVQGVLGNDLVGLYLQGSFAIGDGDDHSDVDFIVVTEDVPTTGQVAELQRLHQRLFALESPWAQHLEGSYAPREQLRRFDRGRAPWWYLDNGAHELELDNHCNTAVVRWSLRERGVVLAGPPPAELVDPVAPDDLREDLLWAMDEWDGWLATHAPWSRRLQTLVVLSYCRMLQSLETGTVTSKREAGEWALRTLDPEWDGLVRAALDDRADPWRKVHEQADAPLVARTREFMAYAAGLARG